MGAVSQERKTLDATAFATMVLLTALWGFHQVAIKVIAEDVSLVMQAAIRSIAATALLVAWARLQGARLFERDGTLPAGIAAGVLFAAEFAFIYAGLAYTHASRMVVFVYLTPPLTALGLHFFVRGERLAPGQWLGVLLAFAGLVVAFWDGLRAEGRSTLLGDFFGVLAAVMWAATILVIRVTRLSRATATRTLFYQLAVSAALLPLVSLLIGEKGVSAVTPLVVASLTYQVVVIAFASYLAWFWLLRRYLAARLSVLSFLTPMFGVLFGVSFLSERLTGSFAVAALLIAVGIALVNLRR